ncbi:MAG TPA: efflux RND transporter periplasmic adaptor subunit, partial [Negativicutes bacterium]|nr:efflux RND transporter periplasmic adaptor subunit [Negativicutes bacterium]
IGFDSVLEETNGKKYVFVVENNKAVKRYLQTGLETDFEIQVIDGLKAGDSYIKSPPATLKEGDPVKQSGGKSSDNKS